MIRDVPRELKLPLIPLKIWTDNTAPLGRYIGSITPFYKHIFPSGIIFQKKDRIFFLKTWKIDE